MNFGDALIVHFGIDTNGQITSVTDKQNRQSRFKYRDDGKLSWAQFAHGSTRTYDYDRLGMRRSRQFDGNARVEYAYSAAGSMSQIQVKNQTGALDGQQLTLDEEQKVRVIERRSGGKTYLNYDSVGNLTAVTSEDGVLRFNYDRFNRLTEVVKPDGERLSYSYADGEPDLRLQMDHHTGQIISDRVDSGLTFSSALEQLRNRTQSSLLGIVRFDRAMTDYRLVSDLGVILPDAVQNSAVMRMKVMMIGGAQL